MGETMIVGNADLAGISPFAMNVAGVTKNVGAGREVFVILPALMDLPANLNAELAAELTDLMSALMALTDRTDRTELQNS